MLVNRGGKEAKEKGGGKMGRVGRSDDKRE